AAQGSRGSQGAQGSQGSQGARGSQGAQGAQGAQGPQGSQGAQSQSGGRQTQEAASEVAIDLDRQRLSERMHQSADAMRAGTEDPKGRGNPAPKSADDPRAQAASQQELAKALDKAADRLASATGSQDAESQKLSEQRARAQELRDRLNETSRALG